MQLLDEGATPPGCSVYSRPATPERRPDNVLPDAAKR